MVELVDPPKLASNFTTEIADGAHGSRMDFSMSSISLAMDPPYLVELDSARSFVIGLVELNDGSRAEEVAMHVVPTTGGGMA